MPAVALLGARQVGKTTLAQTIAKGRDAIYLELEAPEDLLTLTCLAYFCVFLHLLGIDHKKLTYRYQGRDFRLTDVHGHVIKDLLL